MSPAKTSSDDRVEAAELAMGEAQLILAEKRTSLAMMRTGIAVLALPISVLSLLIATSKHYSIVDVMHFAIPLGLLVAGLVALGAYLIVRSVIRIHHHDRMIREIKKKHSVIADWVD